jgi:hypothetical protein
MTRHPSLITGLLAATLAAPALAQLTGPSTQTTPYLLPNAELGDQVRTVSLLTVGDAIDGYRLVGVPDGLGALAIDGERLELFVNHELGHDQGIARAHGARGAFVSRWTLDRSGLGVESGGDLVAGPESVWIWDRAGRAYVQQSTAWNRFCSADLAATSAFAFEGLGTDARILLNGEEYDERHAVDDENRYGRAFAHIVSGPHRGESWELPRLGRQAWENAVASPYPQRLTVVALLDDASVETVPRALHADGTPAPSELFIYAGRKTDSGHPLERAGLTNGLLYAVRVMNGRRPLGEESDPLGLGDERRGWVGSAPFDLRGFGDASNMSGTALQARAIAAGSTRFQRLEDGAWDPRPGYERDFYFVTTGRYRSDADPENRASRLWRLRFDDLSRPEIGGTIEILLRGDEGHQMLDNIAIDRHGRILMQEDPGRSQRLAKVWLYGIESGELIEVASHDPRYFSPESLDALTSNEESSGIIDAEDLLEPGWFLLTSQAHFGQDDAELVRGGQLLALYVAPGLGLP